MSHRSLTNEDVFWIRKASASGKFTQIELCDMAGFSRGGKGRMNGAFIMLINGDTYKDAPGPIKGRDY